MLTLAGPYIRNQLYFTIDAQLYSRSIHQPGDIIKDLLDSLIEVDLGVLVLHVAYWEV